MKIECLLLVVFIFFTVGCSDASEEIPIQLPEATNTEVVEVIEPTNTSVEPVITELIVIEITATSKSEPIIPVYLVTKGTNLYKGWEIHFNVLAELSTGTKLIPANGANKLDCGAFTDQGERVVLCEVEVLSTGQTGLVLEKWISKD